MPNAISTWVVVPLLLITAGLVAGYFPARRAARTDPNVCLRELEARADLTASAGATAVGRSLGDGEGRPLNQSVNQ